MAASAAIGIICKTPKPGSSKTRLLPLLGAAGAAELSGSFLSDVASAIEAVPEELGRQGYAIYAPEGSETELKSYLPAHFGLVCRRDATLGVVLRSATTHLLSEGHDCVVLVNADSPTLPPSLLGAAIVAVRAPGDRVVLGPATDGGYYLIAMKAVHPHLFSDIPWSTPAVRDTTVRRAGEIDLPVATLPLWYDIDDPETLATLLDEISHGALPFETNGIRGGPATATRCFLAKHPELAERLSRRARGANSI
jgi:hypothetical protein